jgi:hypothetical protein
MPPPEDDGALRGFAQRIDFASPRGKGAAAFMHGSCLDDKAAPFQGEAKGFVGRGLLGINPDDQQAGGTQEPHQPIKRYLEGFERAPSPIDQRDIVLTGRMATVCRGCRANIAAAMQLQHQLDALGASYDDSVLLRAACKRDHRFNDSIACWSGTRRSHEVTIVVKCLELIRGQDGPQSTRRLVQAEPVR